MALSQKSWALCSVQLGILQQRIPNALVNYELVVRRHVKVAFNMGMI